MDSLYQAHQKIDQYEILSRLPDSQGCQCYLAQDWQHYQQVLLKIPPGAPARGKAVAQGIEQEAALSTSCGSDLSGTGDARRVSARCSGLGRTIPSGPFSLLAHPGGLGWTGGSRAPSPMGSRSGPGGSGSALGMDALFAGVERDLRRFAGFESFS